LIQIKNAGGVGVDRAVWRHRRSAIVTSGVAAVRLAHAHTVGVLMMTGGATPRSEACMGPSPHGYFGIEARTVDRIAERILALQTAARP